MIILVIVGKEQYIGEKAKFMLRFGAIIGR